MNCTGEKLARAACRSVVGLLDLCSRLQRCWSACVECEGQHGESPHWMSATRWELVSRGSYVVTFEAKTYLTASKINLPAHTWLLMSQTPTVIYLRFFGRSCKVRDCSPIPTKCALFKHLFGVFVQNVWGARLSWEVSQVLKYFILGFRTQIFFLQSSWAAAFKLEVFGQLVYPATSRQVRITTT